jgi:hypothetical protein
MTLINPWTDYRNALIAKFYEVWGKEKVESKSYVKSKNSRGKKSILEESASSDKGAIYR